MNIVFLDFDGVISHFKVRYIEDRTRALDKYNLLLLKKLQDKHDILFVVSSRAWKKDTKEEQEQIFIEYGVPLKLHDDFKTPHYVADQVTDEMIIEEINKTLTPDTAAGGLEVDFDRLRNYRGWEVKAWLDRQPNKEEITYLMIDDDSDYFPIPEKNVIYVEDGEMRCGLSVTEYDEIDKFFKEESLKKSIKLVEEKQSNLN